ncbi:MAG: hypothetical protein HKN57_00715 [Xanthomonadales bacterium]|nr:hypothetical protein [Gammaproteobacteria bacterium]MBT8054659.1 hypothetical protein [Gammaproteobacteria bacterium]NND55749.1 hypothetical protein [Xanthomonadales bacterium]NNK50160.1 hypothetical protein [Xanthomonadales bacterium]
MKTRYIILMVSGALALLPGVSRAHDTPNMNHTHAFQQTGYGQYRQGHYVNGPQGSIIIWSPKTYTGYQNGKTVKFARPSPITRAPGTPVAGKQNKVVPPVKYEKR